MDKKSVLTQVYQNRYPSNWRVYYGRSTRGVAIGVLTTILIVLGFLSFSSIMSLSGFSLFTFILLVLCSLFGFLLYKSIYNGKVDRLSRFVILPEGVIQCYGGNLAQSSCLYFSSIREIELMQRTEISGDSYGIDTRNYYWLDIYCFDGDYFRWWPMNCFGDSAFMCKAVIAAYKHYLHLNYSDF